MAWKQESERRGIEIYGTPMTTFKFYDSLLRLALDITQDRLLLNVTKKKRMNFSGRYFCLTYMED